MTSIQSLLDRLTIMRKFRDSKPIEKNPGAVLGTDLQIVTYPNPKLRMENEEITVFDDELRRIVREMFMVMYAADGIGLAAPQVGINKRLMIFNERGDMRYRSHEYAIVNPVVVASSEVADVEEESCLSFPNVYGEVRRPVWVDVQHQNLKGDFVRRRYEGMLARIFQHEYDHLEQVLFIDRLSSRHKSDNKFQLDRLINKFAKAHGPNEGRP